MAEILQNPVVRALDPGNRHFLKAHRLSAKLNPYPCTIDVLMVRGLPNLKAIPAFQMMVDDYSNGVFEGKDTLVVPSSGNTAYIVARLAPAFGFKKVVVVLSTDVPPLKRGILAALSSVTIIETPGDTMEEAKRQAQIPGALLLDQYNHKSNQHGHALYTGPEIVRVMGGKPDLIAIALGSAGTAMGVANYIHTQVSYTAQILGVQPAIGQQVPGTRDSNKIKIVEEFHWQGFLNDVVTGTRKGSFIRMREAWSEVEPIPGPSLGLVLDGLDTYFKRLTSSQLAAWEGKHVAALCHDSGLLYPDYTTGELDTHEGMM